MKQIIRWLKAKLSRSKSINPPINPESTKPDKTEPDPPKDMQDFANDAPKPNNASDADNETGFNPYDTAKLHKK